MTTVTLDLPDELAQKLQQLNQTELIDALEKALTGSQKMQMVLLPPSPLPKKTFEISREEWYKRLTQLSAWDEETLRDIEEARDYINQWQPKTFS